MQTRDQNLSGKVGIFRKSTGRKHHLHLQQIGGSQENGMNHNQENSKISNGGKSGQYSLSEPSTFIARALHIHICLQEKSRTNISESRVRDGEVTTTHLARVTQTHIFSRIVHTKPFWLKDMWIVLSPRAPQKSQSFVSYFVVHLLVFQIHSVHLFPHHLLDSLHGHRRG